MTLKFRSLLITAALLLPVAQSALASDNLLTLNPDFSDQSSGWTPVDGTYWSISDHAMDKVNEADGALRRIIFKGTEEGRTFTVWNNEEIPVEPNESYKLSAAFHLLAPSNHRYSQLVLLKVFDAYQKEIVVLEGDPVENSRTYSIHPSILTMPAEAVYVKVGLRVTVNATADDLAYLYFDRVSLTRE